MDKVTKIAKKSNNIINIEEKKKKYRERIDGKTTVFSVRTVDNPENPLGDSIKVPYFIDDFDEEVQKLLEYPIQRFGNKLFGVTIKGQVFWIADKDALSVYLKGQGINTAFPKTNGAFYLREYYKWLEQNAPQVADISSLPHYPKPIPEVFYLPDDIPEQPYTSRFDRLIDFFCPATDNDRTLIKAMFMTPLWGGKGGDRPAFVLTGEAEDHRGGIGIGKSILAHAVSRIGGAMLDFGERDKREDIMKQIINSNSIRIVRFDNIKSAHFSSSILEALVTQPYVTGHKLYDGTVNKPNIYTYIFTFNNVSFSKDLTERAVPIRLKRPPRTGRDWESELDEFIEENKMDIRSDIRELFKLPTNTYSKLLRFNSWTNQVLSRLSATDEIINYILDTQSEFDAEDDEREIIEEAILSCVTQFRYAAYSYRELDPESDNVIISLDIIHTWVQKVKPNISKKYCTQLLTRMRFHWLLPLRTRYRQKRCIAIQLNKNSTEFLLITDITNKNLTIKDLRNLTVTDMCHT